MSIIIVSPMDETVRSRGRAAPRLDTLSGKTVALLDISKPGGKVFLDYLARELSARWGVARIVRESKPTYTRRAPERLLRGLVESGSHAVVEALAD